MAMPRVQHISLPPSEPNCVHVRQDIMLWYDEVDADESMRHAASNITASRTSNTSVTKPSFNCSLKHPDKNVTFHDPLSVRRPISPILMGMARDGDDSGSDSNVTLVMHPRHKVCPSYTFQMWLMRLIVFWKRDSSGDTFGMSPSPRVGTPFQLSSAHRTKACFDLPCLRAEVKYVYSILSVPMI